jgi:hypothetical protein
MNRWFISVQLVGRFIFAACLLQNPCRALSPLESGAQALSLRGSCAFIAAIFPRDSRLVREHCERFAPRDADLKVTGKVWDPALRSWMFFIRCARPGECNPFWLPVPDFAQSVESPAVPGSRKQPVPVKRWLSSVSHANTMASPAPPPLIRPGQKATLLWEQGGIRLEATVVCLDEGGIGDRVRARMVRGKTVHAVVVSRKLLKVEL